MSVNHAPQSLPSFAQAFSTSSLSSMPSSNNALPPIQSHSYERTRQTTSPSPVPLSSRQPSIDHSHRSRKRSRDQAQLPTRPDFTSDSVHNDNITRQSPSGRVLRIKEEEEHDIILVSSPSSPQATQDHRDQTSPAINPPSPKKRRVTVSGTHPLKSSNPTSFSDTPHPTPITPVLIPNSEDPSIRSIQTLVKHQPKSLIEQRRESVASIPQSAGPSTMLSPAINSSTTCSATYSPPEAGLPPSKLPPLPRLGRRSPNTLGNNNRCTGNTVPSSSRVTLAQPLTPPPMIVPSQHPLSLTANQQPSAEVTHNPQQSLPSQSLPPPPISFARRRAAESGGRKRKPADIVISPRGTHHSDSLAPVIQSAPPVPEFGRFPMALPRLPTALSGNQSTRRVSTIVPPTPTRFGLQHTLGPSQNGAPRPGPSTRSPPTLPISTSLVPPTPSSLQRPGYSGDKSAFLAPFEMFYDALNDSKQLKNWLSEQLQKSNVLLQSLQKMDQVVEDLVEKKTRTMKEEMQSMRQRVDSLEEALRTVRADSIRKQSVSQGSKFPQNGIPPGPDPSSSYRFPAGDQRRRVSPPSWGADKDHGASLSPNTDRRASISVTRLDAQAQGPYSPFPAGPSHSRGGPVPASNPKGTPPLRSQAVPERTPAHRQGDARQTNRMFYQGLYNGGSNDGTPTSRGNDSHKNPGALEER